MRRAMRLNRASGVSLCVIGFQSTLGAASLSEDQARPFDGRIIGGHSRTLAQRSLLFAGPVR
jgi:hypothetical protein